MVYFKVDVINHYLGISFESTLYGKQSSWAKMMEFYKIGLFIKIALYKGDIVWLPP